MFGLSIFSNQKKKKQKKTFKFSLNQRLMRPLSLNNTMKIEQHATKNHTHIQI